jgi:hypothetical protein
MGFNLEETFDDIILQLTKGILSLYFILHESACKSAFICRFI